MSATNSERGVLVIIAGLIALSLAIFFVYLIITYIVYPLLVFVSALIAGVIGLVFVLLVVFLLLMALRKLFKDKSAL